DVAVLAKHLHLAAEPGGELVQQGFHLTAHRRLEEAAARGEVLLAVIRFQALEPLPHSRPEPFEFAHRAILSASRDQLTDAERPSGHRAGARGAARAAAGLVRRSPACPRFCSISTARLSTASTST